LWYSAYEQQLFKWSIENQSVFFNNSNPKHFPFQQHSFAIQKLFLELMECDRIYSSVSLPFYASSFLYNNQQSTNDNQWWSWWWWWFKVHISTKWRKVNGSIDGLMIVRRLSLSLLFQVNAHCLSSSSHHDVKPINFYNLSFSFLHGRLTSFVWSSSSSCIAPLR
jgi:hypothetical protein